MSILTYLLPFALASLVAPLVAQNTFLYAGTYTKGKSKGIYVWRFDQSTGKLTPLGLAAETSNPSFLAIHPNQNFLYAVNEVGNFKGEHAGSVSAFSIDAKTGKLSLLNQVSSKGDGPCYIALDKTGRTALVANYGGGSIAAFPVGADGRLGEAASFVQDTGSSVDPQRQKEPHAHSIQASPDNRFALAADLGTDRIMLYHLDAAHAKLTPNTPPYAAAAPGSGPRHFAFHPSGKLVYVVNEMLSTVAVNLYDAQAGTLQKIQTVSTLPPDFKGESTTAEILVHPSGNFLYASNRGHDSITVFKIDGDGKLTPTQHVSTQGQVPRGFRIDQSGNFLLVANQKGSYLVEFRIDSQTGQLTPTGEKPEVDSAVCLKFASPGGR